MYVLCLCVCCVCVCVVFVCEYIHREIQPVPDLDLVAGEAISYNKDWRPLVLKLHQKVPLAHFIGFKVQLYVQKEVIFDYMAYAIFL